VIAYLKGKDGGILKYVNVKQLKLQKLNLKSKHAIEQKNKGVC
jgi:hypothetical protein